PVVQSPQRIVRPSGWMRCTWPIWGFGALLTVLLFVGDRASPADRALIKIGGSDAACYFSVAHSLLFDGDFDFTNQYARLPSEDPEWLAPVPATGRPGSPFAIGFPLLEVPFLAAGHLVALALDGHSDGYSKPSIAAYYVGLIFFLCVGLSALLHL